LTEENDPDDGEAIFPRGWTFLLVDDNPAALNILRSMLAMLGAKPPLEAMDGAAAMELVRGNELDCIITDVRMEPMSGGEFIRWVRRSNENSNPTVRILAMSAYRDQREITAVRQEGANGFLGKPVSVPLLEAAIKALADSPDDFVEVVAGPESITIRHHPDPKKGQ
jgi:two-component system, chemotaxis family, chemotaxis protein CheY